MAKVYAHRGASGYCPENTMSAFRKAIEMRSHGIEIDVQMTKDGVIVICHDETLERTTNGKGFIKDLTYDEILKFDAGNGEHIPTLDEFLTLCAETDTGANIELKNNIVPYIGLEEAVECAIRKHNMTAKTIISSFNHNSIALFKNLFPNTNIKTGLLYSNIMHRPEQYAQICKANAVHPNHSSIDKSNIEECHKNGITVNVWTVNTEHHMKASIESGVDTIITNYPDVCIKMLGQI